QGTGLGLATVYGIITGHGGSVHCYSDPGQGTTFRLYWPAATDPDESAGEDQACKVQENFGGTETILVVDDETDIRQVTAEALQSCGYSVLEAVSGEEALAVYAEKGSNVDLIIMDLGMPGMGGRQCLRELVGLDPEVRVLIASGYVTGKLDQEVQKDGAAGFISKPFQFTELLGMVRQVLAGAEK
ncbi:MAG: response regulator, partial [Desulfonatronovibrio sp.]